MAWLFLLFFFTPVLALSVTGNNLTVSADFPEAINSSSSQVNVSIVNHLNASRSFSVYSYIFSGNAVISGNWLANRKILNITPLGSLTFLLYNNITGAGGLYKYRVRIREDNLTTDVTSDLVVGTIFKNGNPLPFVNMFNGPVLFFILSLIGLASLFILLRRL